jgi:hypothetical protein
MNEAARMTGSSSRERGGEVVIARLLSSTLVDDFDDYRILRWMSIQV